MRETGSPIAGRGIDHLVLCVRDLDAAAARYRALGFTVTPRAEHPWGTANQLVQLNGSFLEIIEVADPSKLLPDEPGRFSFGRYIDRYLESREGFGMLVFESSDARADRAEFAEKGLSDFENFDFERRATLPDGREVTVGFSLAFIAPPDMPEAVMFVCQQHAPQYFWNPVYQNHENGAQAMGAVIMVAPDPETLGDRFARLHGEGAVRLEDGILHVATARGWVTVMPPSDYAEWFGPAALSGQTADTPRFEGMRILVSDLEKTAALLKKNGVSADWQRAGLVVPPADLFGVSLAFVQAGSSDSAAGEPVALLS